MSNKFGALLCWLLYLGTVRLVARAVLPFVLAILAMALVFWVLMPWLWPLESPSDEDKKCPKTCKRS